VVSIKGLVKKRPEKLINPKIKTGEIEIEAKSFEILSKAATLPFDFNKENLDVGLPTLLDYRSLTLRHPKVQSIFKVQEALIEGFREAAHKLGCVEVFVPTISASATEGGAELFNFDYFEHKAFLVQSPQLYKQMMVGVFEKVFLLSHIYRAEPSVTTRHLVESIQMDFEIGFIEKFEDLLDSLEFAYSFMIEHTQNVCEEELKFMGVEKSKVLGKIPRLTMR
jgi:nondiscriminating aspartyl-tRNA synthetase